MHMEKLKILGIAGSLRKHSYNKMLIAAAKELCPENAEFEIFDIEGLPVYNEDIEVEGMPEKAKELREAIRSADALLISTPEYNRSVPGPLKNAIDWASRPPSDNVFNEKPVATMGASAGMFGTIVAQYHLREIFSFLNAHPLERPQIFVSRAKEKMTDGKLTDEETRKMIKELLENLAEWAIRTKRK
jgi:chromate reductase